MTDPGDYYDRIEHYSDLIVKAMRTWDGHRIHRMIDHALILPAPPNVDPAHAVIMMLAAQVDPDTTVEQRLGWTRPLETGGAA